MRDNQLTVDEFCVLDLLRRGRSADLRPLAGATPAAPVGALRAAFVRALLLRQVERAEMLPAVTALGGVAISGRLDLEGVELKRSLSFFDCRFDDDIVLRDARLGTLNLQGCALRALRADRALVEGSLMLRETSWSGECRLVGAAIKGDLDLSDAKFGAVSAARVRCDGAILLAGVRGSSVDLAEATAGRGLFAAKAALGGTAKTAALVLANARVAGSVELEGATLGGAGAALWAPNCQIADNLILRGARVHGVVRLRNGAIGGSLNCDGARFDSPPPDGVVLDLEHATIGSYAFIRYGAVVEGGIRLYNARLGGNLELIGATLEHRTGIALEAGLLRVGGDVVVTDGKEEDRPDSPVARTRIVGDVLFSQARIEGSVYVRGTDFIARAPDPKRPLPAVRFNRATVRGGIEFGSTSFGDVVLNLHNARIGVLADEAASWPAPGRLRLNGFEYERIGGKAPTDAASRLDWLGRHRGADDGDVFMPQPYSQLVAVLRRMGHDRDAKEIAIARQRTQRRRLPRWHPRRWLLLAWDAICGYGYRPWLAAAWLGVLFGAGAAVFAAHSDAFVPIRDGVALRQEFLRTGIVPAGYPRFAPIVYAADSMLPIINLGQKDYWAPLAGSPPAWFTPFRLLHTALGWFLTTIFVAGISGLIRRD